MKKEFLLLKDKKKGNPSHIGTVGFVPIRKAKASAKLKAVQ
jgi:hypothetical protein